MMLGFKKKDKDQKKTVKLTGNSIRIHIYRLVNNSPTEIGVFNAELIRDKYNNSVILSEENFFKEEFPGITDALVSDILYKLENRGFSKEEQLKNVNKAISKQEELIKSEKNGFIIKKVEGEEDKKVMINIQTEKMKLRLLKCVKYTLNNKKGEGFFESIEQDGSRSLSYVLIDGELIPYWYKTPTSDGEPVMLVPDISLRKKFYKEATEEAIMDFNESQDTMWRGILKVISLALIVIVALANIGWSVYNARKMSEIMNEDLSPDINGLKLDIEKAKQQCTEGLINQVMVNDGLIDYARIKIREDQLKTEKVIDSNVIGNKADI